jgi:hypothetical protein
MKSDGLRTLGWVVPLACMAVSAYVLFTQRNNFLEASMAQNLANRDVVEAQKEKQKYENMPMEKRFAAVDDVPEEETAFLTYLRTRSISDDVTFDRWLTQSIVYGKDKVGAAKDERTTALLKGISRISSTVTLTGKYANIRKLVGELESSDRLYSLNNLNWVSSKFGTNLTMTVSRYVAPPKPAPPKKPTPSKKAAPTATAPGEVPGITVSQ